MTKYAYVVTGSEDGILGVYSNANAAAKRAAQYVAPDDYIELWRRTAGNAKLQHSVTIQAPGTDYNDYTTTTAEIDRWPLSK